MNEFNELYEITLHKLEQSDNIDNLKNEDNNTLQNFMLQDKSMLLFIDLIVLICVLFIIFL